MKYILETWYINILGLCVFGGLVPKGEDLFYL